MQLVADGTTPVNPDGTADMGTTHPVAVHRDNLNVKLNDANADLKKAKDELKLKTDAIADVKAQARKPHMGNAADRVVPVSKLTDETAKVFGWTKP
jgi:hypothetical protein